MAIVNGAFFCAAKVMHKRLRPRVNQFFYRVFYICFDITKLEKISTKFLSTDSFNLFSFYNKDHGTRDGSSLETWIRKILAEKNLNEKTKNIFLLSFPRVLGYAFSPVSFWFCLDEKENLIAVLSEVNNTFGENHNYLVFNQDHSPIQENQWLETNKDFHVSPFFHVTGRYKFRFIFNQKTAAAFIDYLGVDGEKDLLTSVICSKENLSDNLLLKGFVAIPLMTLKVIFLIHFQALKIILKKIKYISKPIKKSHNLTTNND
jgi:DUF1365 family protein